MQRFGTGRRGVALAWGTAFFFLLAGHARAMTRPTLASPAAGATVSALPVFAWAPVAGAAKYEFQLSSDPGFASLADGGDLFTKNTRATVATSLPDGTLYWRVRASDAAGGVSPWSAARSVHKSWSQAPQLLSPAPGTPLSYPADPVRLTWSRVPLAFKYSVTVATDPSLATPLQGFPVVTSANTLTYHAPDLAPGSGLYYWGVTPQDAEGNNGTPSAVGSFGWTWPTTMTTSLEDLSSADEVFDPRFSWNLVPGAARYEVEVNSDNTFDTGSVVLDRTTIGSSFAPRALLPNNTYYWRVRAIDGDGNTGVWNVGDPFQKSFADETVMSRSSVTNLRMETPDDDGDASNGYQTTDPVIVWDPVPGASSYEVEVALWNGSACDFNHTLRSVTAATAWTPLGPAPAGAPVPPGSGMTVANDGLQALAPGSDYCVRVRPRDRSDLSTSDGNQVVVGTYTNLDSGDGASFHWTGYPTGSACSPSCNSGYLGASDYLTPLRGATVGDTPVFHWNPIAGAASYFVIVARDSAFTTIVDYAFTRIPAYAPRLSGTSGAIYNPSAASRTFSDETTKYYWVVLPSANLNGSAAASNPLSGAASDFLKQTTPPTLLEPNPGASVGGWPSFRWTAVDGARVYELQVDDTNTFAAPLLDDKKTNSTAYTSETTYPADKVLYWRVRPIDDEGVPLTWSATRTFQRTLPKPVWDSGLPTSGATTPTFTWAPITGAVSYDLDTDNPDGKHKQWSDLRSAALTYVYFYGTGVFGQRIRANFPTTTAGSVTHGPWSATLDFTRTLPPPASPATSVTRSAVSLSWSPRPEALEYRVQISKTRDFAQPIESATTDGTSFAPRMTTYGYLSGGRYWWRVAAVDEGRNVGRYSVEQAFTTLRGLRISTVGAPVRRRRVPLNIVVRPFSGASGVPYARVRVWGAGVSSVTKRTHADGSVTFRVRARRRGSVYVEAGKRGYHTVRVALPVRSATRG